jgi:hypothetical protein
MKKLIAAASFTAILLVSCTPKASTAAATPGTTTSTADRLLKEKQFLKVLVEDAISYRIRLLTTLYSG